MRFARPAAATLCLVATATAASGCGDSAGAGERAIARATVAVVERNMTAAEARDAAGYCSTFTAHYLHAHFRGGYASCLRRFRGPAASVERSTDVRFLNASPTSSTGALVHFTLGKARELDYVMRLASAPAGTPPGKRWLIDSRAPPEVG